VQTLQEILSGTPAAEQRRRPNEIADELLKKQLGRAADLPEAAAAILNRAALDHNRSEQARADLREAAIVARVHSEAVQLEFDFWGGYYMTADDYVDAVIERLKAAEQSGLPWRKGRPVTRANRSMALSVLLTCMRGTDFVGFEVKYNADQLADKTGLLKSDVSLCLNLLEAVGAIHRIKRGRTKSIAISPEGVYRGPIKDRQTHQGLVRRFKAEVIDGELVEA